MKRIVLLSILAIISCISFAKGYEVSFSKPSDKEYQLTYDLKDWKLKEIDINGVKYQTIVFDASIFTEDKGYAQLPFLSTSVQLPAQKNVDLSISSCEYKDYRLAYPLLPSRGVIYRNQDPSSIPYAVDPASLVNEFYPVDLSVSEEPYIIRDVRGTTVKLYPFRYNAVTNTLRVYNKVTVTLTQNEQPATNPLLKENEQPVKEAIGMYQSMFINFDASKYDLPIAKYGEILVITTPRDAGTIDSYIQWKREKGYIVHKEIVNTGTNVKTMIQQQYTNNNNILYVQLVGDWADIKSDQVIDNSPTDPKMGCVVGTDNFPDIAIGRFSCSNEQQLTTQINKAIDYEKNPNMEPNWRETFIGIGSAEGNGIGDDGEMDKVHVENIYTQKLQPFTYNSNKQNYDPGASASTLLSHINAGGSTIAYTGHGSETSFVTTGFSNSHVNQLTNGDKLPFIVAVACVNGAFHISSDCFAEAWLKKANGGAVVTLMSTINQPWTPPMRGQDYFYDVLSGGYNYSLHPGQNGISTTEQRTHWGSIVVNAFNLMLTENSSTSDVQTVHTWCTFGDVSLQLRTKQPVEIESSMTTMLVGMPFSTTITAGGVPVEDALVCVSQDGVYYSALTNAFGEVSIETDFVPGEILLVVSAFNTTTIYRNIECIPAEGSYIIKDSYTLEGDNILSFGETTALTIAMKNVGVASTTTNTQVTISCNSPLLTVNTATASYPPIAAGQIVSVPNAFNITASENITDGQTFTVNIVAVNEGNSWESNMYIKAYKPVLNYSGLFYGGSFTPGTTIALAVNYKNIGGFTASNAIGTLSSSSSYVNILNPTESFGNIAPQGEGTGIYYVEINDNTPVTETINFTSSIVADGNITANGNFSISNSCNLVFTLTDTYGDGWNGASLIISFSNGAPSQTLTLPSGSTGTYNVLANSGTTATINFTSGSYNYECGFTVKYEDGTLIYQANPGSLYAGVVTSFVVNCGNTATGCDPVSSLNAEYSNSNVILTWNADAAATSFKVKRDGVEIGTCTNKTYTDVGVVNGSHTYCIIALYSGCSSLPVCASVNVTVCNAPTGLEAEAVNNTVILTWDELLCADNFNIYRNGALLSSNITASNFTDEEPVVGSLCYTVTAVNQAGESEPSNEFCVNYLSINNVTTNDVNIYPNPTSGKVTVAYSNMNQIDIYSLTGVVVKSIKLNSNIHSFDISNLANGTYLIKIIHNEGILIKKLVKK